MLALLRERLMTAIESGRFIVETVALTSPINHSTKRTFEMIVITEGEIVGWVGCWKQSDCLTNGSSAPRVWINDSEVDIYPGAGMEGGFSIKVDSAAKAEHIADELQSALDEAFDSINVGEARSDRTTTRCGCE